MVRSPFSGTSYFDTALTPDAAARYEVTAIAPEGNRSPASIVQLPGTNAENTTQAPQAVSATVYSSTAAELFWVRANEDAGVVSTEVIRDGMVIGNSPGNSYFDDSRTEGANHVYTLVANRCTGR